MDSGDSSHAPPEPSSPSLYPTALPAAPTPSAASLIAPLLSAQPLSNSVPGMSGGGCAFRTGWQYSRAVNVLRPEALTALPG